MNGLAIVFIASRSLRSCAPHTWMTTGAPGLATGRPRPAQRRCRREEERVEAGDQVEGVVVVGQGLHVADAQVGAGDALAREFDQGFGRIEPERSRAAVGNQAQECAHATADVEDELTRFSETWRSASS